MGEPDGDRGEMLASGLAEGDRVPETVVETVEVALCATLTVCVTVQDSEAVEDWDTVPEPLTPEDCVGLGLMVADWVMELEPDAVPLVVTSTWPAA